METNPAMRKTSEAMTPILRLGWDSGNLETLVKHSPARAVGAHVSIIGHITRDEARRYLSRTEAAGGFANRFLWACVQRSKVLPRGGTLREEDLVPLRQGLAHAIAFARTATLMRRDDDADAVWDVVYGPLSEGKRGLVGAVIGRAEAQVMRLATIYALLDCSELIRPTHLFAALALWDYCEASAGYIFGDTLGDPVADELLRAVRMAGAQGLTRTQIRDLFGRNRNASEIERALSALSEGGLARCEKRTDTGGRHADAWIAVTTMTTETIEGPRSGGLRSSQSFLSYLGIAKIAPSVILSGAESRVSADGT